MPRFTSIPKQIEEALSNSGASRRDFLKGAGAFAVGISLSEALPTSALAQAPAAAAGAGPYKDPDFRQLDSWVVIHENNTATFYVGKTDCGQGTGTAFRQLMADELDIGYDQTTCIMGSTHNTVDQGDRKSTRLNSSH